MEAKRRLVSATLYEQVACERGEARLVVEICPGASLPGEIARASKMASRDPAPIRGSASHSTKAIVSKQTCERNRLATRPQEGCTAMRLVASSSTSRPLPSHQHG